MHNEKQLQSLRFLDLKLIIADFALCPMFSAETYIFIVGTEDDLFTDFGNSAFTVKPRVHDRFPSAPTNCFYLFNRVGKSHESVTALKKLP